MKHFVEISECSPEQLQELLGLAVELKKLYKSGGRDLCLAGKTMALIFEKPSSRTRLSFEVGMMQLGGGTIYLSPADIGGLGKREPIKDLMRVLNGMVDVVVVRTFAHSGLLEMTEYATVPIINALTDKAHPCQGLADVLTIQEHCGDLAGKKVAFVGDGNNVAYSLAVACMKLKMQFALACPKGYGLPDDSIAAIAKEATNGQFTVVADPAEAVVGADVVYTDTWVSMGQEDEKQQRIDAFKGYQVDMAMMEKAGPAAKVMHCLPAYRGLEISDEVIESEQSVVFDQAENRLHGQRALLKYLFCQ